MGWEERGGRFYYYTKRREGDRVVSEYVGTGIYARAAAVLDEKRQRDEAKRCRQDARWRGEIEQSDRALLGVLEHLRTLTRAALVAEGYHTHTKANGGNDVSYEVAVPTKEMAEIMDRTNVDKPKAEDVRALRKLFGENPELWRIAGDYVRMTEAQIVANVKGTAFTRESFKAALKGLRHELGYEKASALERLLIDQVTLTWLHYHNAQYRHEGVMSKGTSFRNAEWLEKRLNGAHRRYIRAMEALARVRKMQGRGPVQINIAEQQVNVAS